jgi:hypothetical protein
VARATCRAQPRRHESREIRIDFVIFVPFVV